MWSKQHTFKIGSRAQWYWIGIDLVQFYLLCVLANNDKSTVLWIPQRV